MNSLIVAEVEEAVKVGGLQDLSIIEVIICNIAWVACEAHFSWVWGHPLRKTCKNTCCEIGSGAYILHLF